jgi:hypothetical protein
MGQVKCQYNWHGTGRQVFYDAESYETLLTGYPVQFVEDFLGSAGGGPFDGSAIWKTIDVSASGTVVTAMLADTTNGQFQLALDAADEDQDAVLYMNDQKPFDVGNGLIFEARINVAVSMGTGVCAVFGMAGDHNLDKDTVTEAAWFRLQAADSILVETDDTTNDNDDQDTGIDVVNGTFNIYRIDFTTLSDVKFFIDGVRVLGSTTFDMSNLSASEQQMQPYFSIDKASGDALGTMNIDYVKIFSNRS